MGPERKLLDPNPRKGHVTNLNQRKQRLIRACEITNHDSEVREVEEEFDALADEIPELWEDAPAR
jgi:hypothetical protein